MQFAHHKLLSDIFLANWFVVKERHLYMVQRLIITCLKQTLHHVKSFNRGQNQIITIMNFNHGDNAAKVMMRIKVMYLLNILNFFFNNPSILYSEPRVDHFLQLSKIACMFIRVCQGHWFSACQRDRAQGGLVFTGGMCDHSGSAVHLPSRRMKQSPCFNPIVLKSCYCSSYTL